MNNDVCMGGVTLRSLLENKEFLTMPARAKIGEKDDKDCNAFCDAAAAFLGPNLWDKTLSDFKLEYVDFDDILGANITDELHRKMVENTPPSCVENSSSLIQLTPPISTQLQVMPPRNQTLQYVPHPIPHTHPEQPFPQNMSPSSSPQRVPSTSSCDLSEDQMQLNYSQEQNFPPKDLAMATLPPKNDYNSCVIPLQEDVLKPQPMVRKSQKHFVPDNLKDDKYWARRRKNNLAAKRSREARRVKENQIVLRASFLEKENNTLKDEVLRLKAENDMLKTQLNKFKH